MTSATFPSHRRHDTGMVETGVSPRRWPRGLATAGLLAALVSIWGALVAFLGPAIAFHANTSPSWHWSSQHAWLYVLPGAVGLVASVAIMRRASGGRILTRLSLAFLGLVLVACGAWFVLGPPAWPVISAGSAFSLSQTPLRHFLVLVGYNLGVGLVLAVVGGIVVSASLGERELTGIPTADPAEPAGPDKSGGTYER